MPDFSEKDLDQIRDHLRVAEKVIRLIAQLAQGPNSCDHKLVHGYALNALSRVQAAKSFLAAN